jgi:bifunctional ADP-heptose synthase (sugar kinase/adenylyltransferase)
VRILPQATDHHHVGTPKRLQKRSVPNALAGVVGRDLPGGQVLDLLDAHEIAPYLWADVSRPTTNKTRFILRGQLRPDRFDFESKAPIPGDAAEYLAACPIGDALLIQDYGKGVCTASLIRSLLALAQCHLLCSGTARAVRYSSRKTGRLAPLR